MTDEQFQKMHAVELAKLACLQGIMTLLQSMAVKQGAAGGSIKWDKVAELLATAEATAAKSQQS